MSEVVIKRSRVSRNSATADGGGIYADLIAFDNATVMPNPVVPELIRSSIANNSPNNIDFAEIP